MLQFCERAEIHCLIGSKPSLPKTNQTSAAEPCPATREADEGNCITKNPNDVKIYMNNETETYL